LSVIIRFFKASSISIYLLCWLAVHTHTHATAGTNTVVDVNDIQSQSCMLLFDCWQLCVTEVQIFVAKLWLYVIMNLSVYHIQKCMQKF